MAFKVDPNIRQQILILLNLWQESLDELREVSVKSFKKRKSLRTSKFLKFVNNLTGKNISYDLFKKYVENDPEIQSMVGDLNRNKIVIKQAGEDEEVPAEEMPAEQPPAEEMPAEQPPAEEMPAEQPPAEAEPAPAPPEEPEPETGEEDVQSRRKIIASMAARARRRREKL